jgi:GNAT superfamily N-acetyltransferase
MHLADFSVRAAAPNEIDELMRIDDDASELFQSSGMDFRSLTAEHPFVCAEHARWLAAAQSGSAYLALDAAGEGVAFMALSETDGAPYLDQLSVRMRAMRRGLGRALVARAARWARERADVLWLTTYGHVAWNRPYYERFGFHVVPASECGPEMRACLAKQRAALPCPEHRVAMRLALR